MNETINIDRLVGPLEENFYSLGIKDRDGFFGLLEHLKHLSKLRPFDKIFKNVIKLAKNKILSDKSAFDIIIDNYAQGLGVDRYELLTLIYLPEMISSQSKWIPEFLSLIPGCSSLFVLDEKNNGVIHSRILDFPLTDQYEKYERSMLMDVRGLPKVLSHSTRGHCIPGMTSMNEFGLTIAIHQKFSNYFNVEGEPIVKIAFDIITQASDVNEAKKILRNKTSMTYWGLYLSDAKNEVLAVDICGNQIYSEKYSLNDNKVLYFNNLPIIKDKLNNDSGPLCYLDSCQMKFDYINKELSQLKKIKDDLEIESIKTLSTIKLKKDNNALNWLQKPLTPASVQLTSFNNKTMRSLIVTGPLPKTINDNVYSVKDIFEKAEIEKVKVKVKKDNNIIKGMNCLSLAQSYYDKKEAEKAYHQIQMATIYLKDYEEFYIAQFFFVIWQYLFAESKADFKAVYSQLINLKDKLPTFLNDHFYLFLLRIEKVCGMPITADDSKINKEIFKTYFEKEKKLRPVVIKMMRKLIYPRLELPDIIYMY